MAEDVGIEKKAFIDDYRTVRSFYYENLYRKRKKTKYTKKTFVVV
jgi:hypothetical protein